jgi:hypothetical protein
MDIEQAWANEYVVRPAKTGGGKIGLQEITT